MNHSPNVVRLGFTATPPKLKGDYSIIFPKILSRYSIFSAIKNQHIVPPQIICKKKEFRKNAYFWLEEFYRRPYRKAVVWCGMI